VYDTQLHLWTNKVDHCLPVASPIVVNLFEHIATIIGPGV